MKIPRPPRPWSTVAAATWLAAGLIVGLLHVPVSAQAPGAPAQPPLIAPPAAAAAPAPAEPPDASGEQPLVQLIFKSAPLEMVLEDYSEKTGRTLLLAPKLPKASINLTSQGKLPLDRYLEAVKTVLAMNGIALLPEGDEFIRVVVNKDARREPLEIREALPEGALPESSELVSQMITLKHIEVKEAKGAIDAIRHAYGQLHLFEGVNTLLVTDDSATVNRIVQIIRFIDQPTEAKEEPNIVQIRYAKAADIKKKLEEIIAESQKELASKKAVARPSSSGPPTMVRSTVPGVIRAKKDAPTVVGPAAAELIEAAERGIVRGKVQIVADDRTNILIIITRVENMPFFEKIIQVLDVETQPDVVVRIIRLEYAEAEEVATTLNTLIGKDSKSAGKDTKAPAGGEGEGGRAAALRDYVQQLRDQQTKGPEAAGKSKLGELSADNIKILSDKRTNSLLLMASRSDFAALEEIIKSMDMMLSQVLVESVIIQVNLDDSVSSGIHWIQRALLVVDENRNGTRDAKGAFAGHAGGGRGDDFSPVDLTEVGPWSRAAGLTAYFTHFGLNLDMLITMVQSDSRSRIISTPVIVTTDNTEATISASEQKYFLKGSTVDQFGNVRPETEIRDIGLELKVTPHINESKNVMMEISQEVSDEGAPQLIADLGTFPTTTTRKFNASIAVTSGETIVLGGLVRRSQTDSRTGIPILGRIPLLGRLFRSDTDTDDRAEVVVFVTPYVLDTPDEIWEESRRRKRALDIGGMWQQGWSNSKLAEPLPDEIQEQLEQELE